MPLQQAWAYWSHVFAKVSLCWKHFETIKAANTYIKELNFSNMSEYT